MDETMQAHMQDDFPVQAQMLVARMIAVEGYTMEEERDSKLEFGVNQKYFKSILKPTIEQLVDEVYRRYDAFEAAKIKTVMPHPSRTGWTRKYAIRHLVSLSPTMITQPHEMVRMKSQMDAILREIEHNNDADMTNAEACE